MEIKLNFSKTVLAFLLIILFTIPIRANEGTGSFISIRIDKQQVQRKKSLIYYSSKSDNKSQILERKSQKLVNDLDTRLNLTPDQTKEITSILTDNYKSNNEAEVKNTNKNEINNSAKSITRDQTSTGLSKETKEIDKKADKEITAVLNKDQISKYKNYKGDWWKKINAELINNNMQNNNGHLNSSSSQSNPVINNEYGIEGVLNKKKVSQDSAKNIKQTPEGNDTALKEMKYRKNAKGLSIDLMKKLDLSLEQAAEVRNALVDYQKDIYDAQESNLTGKSNEIESVNPKNKSSELLDNNGKNNKDDLVGGKNKKLIEAYKSADKKANDRIENTLNKEQSQMYKNIKSTWWLEVKDRIYSDEMNDYHKKLQNNKPETGRDKYNIKNNKEVKKQ